MQMPGVGLSTERHLDEYGEHLLAALAAHPKTKGGLDAFERVQHDLRSAQAARLVAERLVTRAEALSAQSELEVEDALRSVEGPLLLATKKRRDLDPYKSVFPDGLGGAIAPRGPAQVVEAERVARAVQALPEAVVAAGSALVELGKLTESLSARLASQRDAETALISATTAEQVQKRRWREQYRQTFGTLVALFPQDARKVESFFKKPSKRERDANGIAPPVPTPRARDQAGA